MGKPGPISEELMTLVIGMVLEIEKYHREDAGGNCVLVFLPGIADIETVCVSVRVCVRVTHLCHSVITLSH